METILIPEYKDLKNRLTLCVDRFFDVTLELMYTLRIQSAEHKISPKLRFILKKIVKENDISNNGLMRLLSTCTLEFVKFAVNNETKGRKLKIQQEMDPTETVDKNLESELELKINNLEKLKESHTNILRSLIENQKGMWKPNHKNDPKAEEKSRTEYLQLIETEDKVMKELKQITEPILNDLQDRISSRVSDTLEILGCLVADFVADERSADLVSVINDIDITTVTREIIESFCKPYRYTVPSEYFRFHDRQLLKAPQTMIKDKMVIRIDLDEDKDIKLYTNRFRFFSNIKSRFVRFFRNIFGKKGHTNQESSNKLNNKADKYKQIYSS